MPDNLTAAQRSHCMSRVKSKNTSIEMLVMNLLKKRSLRFRRHFASLPGKPDIVFNEEKVAVFIDGDFWHGYRFPVWRSILKPTWQKKIGQNRTRDRRNFGKLRRAGWKVIRIWQHSVQKNLPFVVDGIEKQVLTASRTTKRHRSNG